MYQYVKRYLIVSQIASTFASWTEEKNHINTREINFIILSEKIILTCACSLWKTLLSISLNWFFLLCETWTTLAFLINGSSVWTFESLLLFESKRDKMNIKINGNVWRDYVDTGHWHCAFVIQYRKIITIPNLLPLQDDKPSGAKGQIIGIF